MKIVRLMMVGSFIALFAFPGVFALPTPLEINFDINETEPLHLLHGHRCQESLVNDHKFYGIGQPPTYSPDEADEVRSVPIYKSRGCRLFNFWGATGEGVSAFEANPDQPYHFDHPQGWSVKSVSGTDTTVSIKYVGGSGKSKRFVTSVTDRHLSKSSISYRKDSENQWLRWLEIPEPKPYLKYSDGTGIRVRGTFLTPNGRYLVLNIYQRGLAIYDIYDQTVTPVLDKYDVGNTAASINLSDDGRYLLVSGELRANSTKRELLLIDTTGCTSQPLSSLSNSGLLEPSGCEEMDLKEYISDNYLSVLATSAVWINPNADEFVVKTVLDDEGQRETRWLKLVPTGASSPAGYLAMGDSYTSGEGDSNGDSWYEADTDNQGNRENYIGRNLCHLSRRSYPYLIAQQLGYNIATTAESDAFFHSVACSGARIHNVVGGHIGEKHTPGSSGEFSKTDNQYLYNPLFSLSEWQPGGTKQLKSISGEYSNKTSQKRIMSPEIITIGIGGNDAGFGDFIKSCILPTRCDYARPGSDSALQTAKRIASMKRRLVNTYQQLHRHAPQARIYVHGYPQLFNEERFSCGAIQLGRTERRFGNHASSYINEVIETAAQEAGVFYIDVEDIFKNQRLCDKGKTIINGIASGNDVKLPLINKYLIGNESFHPNEKGFLLYKSQILAATDNLSAPMPSPQPDLAIPLPDKSVFGEQALNYVERLNETYDYRQVEVPEIADMISPLEGTEFEVMLDGLEPNSTVEITVHSTPTELGQFTADNSGSLAVNLQLPDLESGYHELRAKATAINGQLTAYYQSFVLGGSENDFDGDGISNDTDQCPTLVNQADTDNDGINDACDPFMEPAANSDESEQVVDDANQGSNATEPNIEGFDLPSNAVALQTDGEPVSSDAKTELNPDNYNSNVLPASTASTNIEDYPEKERFEKLLIGAGAAILLILGLYIWQNKSEI